jgi:hypothetical protein
MMDIGEEVLDKNLQIKMGLTLMNEKRKKLFWLPAMRGGTSVGVGGRKTVYLAVQSSMIAIANPCCRVA